jgi:hypothetical protein
VLHVMPHFEIRYCSTADLSVSDSAAL